jgi:uncharacterized membrane protein YfcA
MDIILQYGIYILLGTLAGTLSGLLGVGGGIIVIPAFLILFQSYGFSPEILMHCAAGTSLAAMIVTSGFAVFAHYRNGAQFGKVLYKMIPGLIIGTALGSIAGFYINSQVLRSLFGLFLIWVAFKEFFIKRAIREPSQKLPATRVVFSGASGIGIFSGLLGIGGGTMIVPFLEYIGIPIRRAISISTVCGLVIAVIGTISFILVGFNQPNLPPHSLGFVYLPAALGVSIGSPLFAFLGTYLHHRIKVTLLKRLFSIFVLIVGIKLLF